MQEIILLENPSSSSKVWPNLVRRKRLDLSVEQIIAKYQGVEGEVIDFYLVEEDDTALKEAIDLFLEAPKINDSRFLYIISNSKEIPVLIEYRASKMGYEVGICVEDSIYSSISNEILFGVVDELVVFKDVLNENLLFPDTSLAESYIKVHNEMSAQGKDVEDYMEMTIYEIWKFKTN